MIRVEVKEKIGNIEISFSDESCDYDEAKKAAKTAYDKLEEVKNELREKSPAIISKFSDFPV